MIRPTRPATHRFHKSWLSASCIFSALPTFSPHLILPFTSRPPHYLPLYVISGRRMPNSPAPSPARPTQSRGHATPTIRQQLQARLYDAVNASVHSFWLAAVLQRLPERTHLLYIGLMTATPLIRNAHIINASQISIVALIPDEDRLPVASEAIHSAGLSSCVHLVTHPGPIGFTPPTNRLFTHVYMATPLPAALDEAVPVVRSAINLLVDREDGRLFFAQTFELQKNRLRELVPSALSAAVLADGASLVSYQADFEEALHVADAVLVTDDVLEDGRQAVGVRESHLIEARSRLYVPVVTETVL